MATLLYHIAAICKGAVFRAGKAKIKAKTRFQAIEKPLRSLDLKGFSLVDDTGLEPVTSRTSSGCSYQLS